MNAEKYHQIWINHAMPSRKCLIGSSLIFQHDNDPKHALVVTGERKEKHSKFEYT